jgi:hypothetical protein
MLLRRAAIQIKLLRNTTSEQELAILDALECNMNFQKSFEGLRIEIDRLIVLVNNKEVN